MLGATAGCSGATCAALSQTLDQGTEEPDTQPPPGPNSRKLDFLYINFFSNLYSYLHPEIKTAEAQLGPKPGKEPRVKHVLTASISPSVKRALGEVSSKSPDWSMGVGHACVQVDTYMPELSSELPKWLWVRKQQPGLSKLPPLGLVLPGWHVPCWQREASRSAGSSIPHLPHLPKEDKLMILLAIIVQSNLLCFLLNDF